MTLQGECFCRLISLRLIKVVHCPRFGLFRTAYAQLRPCKPWGCVAERYRYAAIRLLKDRTAFQRRVTFYLQLSIIAQVAGNQYGGQSISLAHLAPFVQVSRERIRRETLAEIEELGVHPTEEKINDIVDKARKEVNRGVQTIGVPVVTLLTTNGQAPFVTVFMYLNEAKNEQEKHDLAMIITKLEQRHKGVKNEKGVDYTAFQSLFKVLVCLIHGQ